MTEQPRLSEVTSFSRRGGRLDQRRQRAWDDLAERYVIEPPRGAVSTSVDPSCRFDPEAEFGRSGRFVVEIGSGHGDALAHAAAESPDTNFLALEVWRPGVASALVHIRRDDLTNVRLMQVNAAEAVATMLRTASIDELWLFFPDPWHKLRHHKRRLVTPDFADKVARVLKPGGVWRLATDWNDYANQMRIVLAGAKDFDAREGVRFDGRVPTRFEIKGAHVGRDIHDFTAVRLA